MLQVVFTFVEIGGEGLVVLEQQFGGPTGQLGTSLCLPQEPTNLNSYKTHGPVDERAFGIVIGESPPQGDGALLQDVACVATVRNYHQHASQQLRFVLDQQSRELLVGITNSHIGNPLLA